MEIIRQRYHLNPFQTFQTSNPLVQRIQNELHKKIIAKKDDVLKVVTTKRQIAMPKQCLHGDHYYSRRTEKNLIQLPLLRDDSSSKYNLPQ